MKTSYLNPYGQAALQTIHQYGNITKITENTEEINTIINNTPQQEQKKINNIQELCYDKIRYYYNYQAHNHTTQYNYLTSPSLTDADTIATHTLLQATAITYGSESYEADNITEIIKTTTRNKLEQNTNNEILDNALQEYINTENTHLNDILPLINEETLTLDTLLLNKDKLILTYKDFITIYHEYLEHRRPETMYEVLCMPMKKELLIALIEEKTRNYLKLVEEQLKQIEPAAIIKKVGKDIKQLEIREREEALKKRYGRNNNYTNYNDDQPTPYIPEAFPPCIKKILGGISSGGRNYAVSLLLTPFLSYARLYPGVYARHIKNPKITDMDPTLNVTKTEIIPLIYEAAQNCKPPLFKDQPHEKANINSKLGFGENTISYDNTGKTPWYTPMNCKSIKEQQPGLCTPCKDCQRIGNPLSYYNRKRKLLSKGGNNDNAATKTSNQG